MSTGVIITLIICGTIVLLSLISQIGSAFAVKKASKDLKELLNEEDK